MIIDAENLIIGRLTSYAAKQALNGEKIDIINCEKAVMSGRKKDIEVRYRKKSERGDPYHGPFIRRRPDMFVRRIIRGMLPYKQFRGKEAFKRIMCYNNVPEEFKKERAITLENAHIIKVKNLKHMTIREITNTFGAK